VFIYMQLILGQVLKDYWSYFNNTEKMSVCDQLSQILGTLRGYRQSDSDHSLVCYLSSVSEYMLAADLC